MKRFSSQKLATLIYQEIARDFENQHLTHNYVRTMQTRVVSKNEAIVKIPAPKYDMPKFIREGVIVRTIGSYATELEKQGSVIEEIRGQYRHLGNHQRVITKGTRKAISKFIKRGMKGKLIVWKIKV